MPNQLYIAVVDIGSPMTQNGERKIGCIILQQNGDIYYSGNDLEECTSAINKLLTIGPVALGFEAPLFIPMSDNWLTLLGNRSGEGSHRWSYGAGAQVTTMALAEASYVLKKLRDDTKVLLDYHEPLPTKPGELFIFEAFVSGYENEDKFKDEYPEITSLHEKDALAGANAFLEWSQGESREPHVTCKPNECLNLIGTMLLRFGISNDRSILKKEILVIKTKKPYPKPKPKPPKKSNLTMG